MSDFITDSSMVNQLGNQFEKMGEKADKEIVTLSPPKAEVNLPGGFIGKDETLIKYAEVRELNGADEEAISKTSDASKALNVVLQRGLVALGDNKVDKDALDSLLAGDRDAILLGIRIATFGKDIQVPVTCSCGTPQNLNIDLETDVEVKELDNPIHDRVFSVETKSGVIQVCLPNGITQRKLMESTEQNTAERVTTILSGCIVSVNGSPSMGRTTALSLGIAERETLILEIYSRNPGPRLGEVSKACKACGSDISVSLSLADLFRL